jgi:hypothetical protein
MTAIVAGIYRQGKLELLETPAGLREGPVQVVLMQDEVRPAPRYLTFGKYREGRESTLEDFKDAEWRGEEELGEQNGN